MFAGSFLGPEIFSQKFELSHPTTTDMSNLMASSSEKKTRENPEWGVGRRPKSESRRAKFKLWLNQVLIAVEAK